jgi:hypothetical protein
LPAIELPKFSGGYVHWLSFQNTFKPLIVRNTTLSNVQKLADLKNKAKALIVNLPITNENFTVADTTKVQQCKTYCNAACWTTVPNTTD